MRSGVIVPTKFRTFSGALTRIKREIVQHTHETLSIKSMIDGEFGTNVSDSSQVDKQEKILESKITKAVDKLKYYLEETDELIENNEISELRIASKRTDEIRDELNDLISRVQELKLDSETQRKGRSGYGKRI